MSKNKLSSLGNHGTTTTSSLSSSSSISNNTSIARIIFVFSNILKLVQSIPIGHITHEMLVAIILLKLNDQY